MITPDKLKPGDRIAIVSPARKITPAEVEPSIGLFRSWGLEVVLGDHVYSSINQFAGNDGERLEDLQKMLDDPSVKAIICSRGGYGTVRILDRLDFTRFVQNPKWIVGYSDVTVLHSHINKNYGIETLHAMMPVNYLADHAKGPSADSLHKALFGERLEYQIQGNIHNREGKANGVLVGGNLSILYSLNGTSSDMDTTGKVLFLEDLDEYLYHIDRMMMNLKRSGKLENLAGLLVGGMTKMRDNEVPYGKTAEEIIREAVEAFDYPVCFGFPAGHAEDNRALILGRSVSMEVSEVVKLKY